MISALLTLGLVLGFCYGGGIGLVIIFFAIVFVLAGIQDGSFIMFVIGAGVILWIINSYIETFYDEPTRKAKEAYAKARCDFWEDLYHQSEFNSDHNPKLTFRIETEEDRLVFKYLNDYGSYKFDNHGYIKSGFKRPEKYSYANWLDKVSDVCKNNFANSQEHQALYTRALEHEELALQEIAKLKKLRVIFQDTKIPAIRAIWEDPKRDWYNEFYHDLYFFDTRNIKKKWHNLSTKIKNIKFIPLLRSLIKKLKNLPHYHIDGQH